MKFLFVFVFILPSFLLANIKIAENAYFSKTSKVSKYRTSIIELVNDKFYFSAIPLMKEYLTLRGAKIDSKLEQAFDKMLNHTGLKQFEVLPLTYLNRSTSDNVKYIIAKKLLKNDKTTPQALKYAEAINPNHPVYPYATHLLGAAYASINKLDHSLKSYNDCIRVSESRLRSVDNDVEKRSLTLNHQYCILGKARVYFASQDYKKADLSYLDILKSSLIWPEVLIEEAWTSYYLGNYNRTLGKLVTYKAPVFDYVFNPEIDVLNALAYMKLCLFDDAKKVADKFYDEYLKDTRALRLYLKRYRTNYKYFYRLMVDFEKSASVGNPLISNLLKSISRDGAYIEVRHSLIQAANEAERIKSLPNSRMKGVLISNIDEVLNTQRDILGAFVKGRLVGKYADLYKAFEGMSYIKLEVLAQKKDRLYKPQVQKKRRGDIKYIEKNEKQYFWDFNGEFWADELGDYVFALKSEC